MNISERTAACILLLLVLSSPAPVRAVSYPPLEEQREEKAAEGISEKGEAVCLFQSGTADVRNAINIGDVLTVFREGLNRKLKVVGKVRVLSYVGDDYLKGEVIEGEIMAGDIAKKGDAASLVISTRERCK
ncbi:MAG: hypothetical protein HGB21_10405 [Nitrospirae bacterium]|nr:hypothetical protein [Nitrospirota bacterium]NTW66699.1 hypothetical protein [Nitrospirota bacterium]